MSTINKARPLYKFSARLFCLDLPLLGLMLLLILFGLCILFSSSNQDLYVVLRQIARMIIALLIMMIFASIPPHKYKIWIPWIYWGSLGLLVAVMLVGKMGKGAQRWLDLGILRFQPSEIMKIIIPMMTAWYYDNRNLPNDLRSLLSALLIILIPAFFIAKQPDLGTAIMVAAGGIAVIFLAGLAARIIIITILVIICSCPFCWYFLQQYQKQRILTLFNPESDPLGAGYHIIQSKIAIGSGGIFGKGWFNGSQSHLNFLPEHSTDFIFAVNGEEFGFIGSTILILLVMFIALRSIYIAKNAQTFFARLLAGGLAITFFLSAFVNIGMVLGILPVVGIPLPLVSYGGTAMVSFFASFGILMSISSHRILFMENPFSNNLHNRSY